MDSVAVTVPLRPPMKKMKKRKELDALAPPHAILRRTSGKRSSQELLTDSSDDRSESWNVTTRDPRKSKTQKNRFCPALLRACSAFLACTSVLATAILIWLFIDVRQQLTALRTELDQVILGNEKLPDEIQKCHTWSKDLLGNQSVIFSNLSNFKGLMNEFRNQLTNIQENLGDVPDQLKSLQLLVADFTSKMVDIEKVKKTYETIQRNISMIEQTIFNKSNTTLIPPTNLVNETKKEEGNTTMV